MPGTARIVVPGIPHHVTQKGNNRQEVFLDDSDREEYLGILKKYCDRCHLEIQGYCQMPDHVHIVATPLHESSLGDAIGMADLTIAGKRWVMFQAFYAGWVG